MTMISTDAWLDIWFKPYNYLHKSWTHNIDNRLLSETHSSLAWQSSYHYICAMLNLRADYYEEQHQFIRALIEDLANDDFQVIDMASFMVTGTFKLVDVDLNQKRFLLQRSRALSLKKRLYEPVPGLSEIDAGLMLIKLLCDGIDSYAWQRIKLFFDKSRVNFVEVSANAIDLSDITRRSVIRACNEIYQLKFSAHDAVTPELEPEQREKQEHQQDVSDYNLDIACGS